MSSNKVELEAMTGATYGRCSRCQTEFTENSKISSASNTGLPLCDACVAARSKMKWSTRREGEAEILGVFVAFGPAGSVTFRKADGDVDYLNAEDAVLEPVE